MAISTTSSGLEDHGLEPGGRVFWNPTTSLLYMHALTNGDATLAEGGPLVVDTGKHTGRSAKDKFFVQEPESEDRIAWGDVNQPISEGHFGGLREKVVEHLNARDLYVVNAHAGADPAHRLRVRVLTASPWHALFAKTLFIDPEEDELADFEPDAVVFHAPPVEADPAEDGTRSETFVVLHPARAEVLIGGTDYAGEIKKSIFTVMNDRLPLEGVFPMHCSANVDGNGRVAIFFGLSGTGKTTLSADPERRADRRRRARLGRLGRLQLRGRLLREGDPPLGGGRAGDLQGDARLRHRARERRRRRARRARPRRRLEDGEHTRRLQARADRQRPSREARGAPERGRLPHGRRLRRPPADRAPHARPGALLLPHGLHGEARRDGDRRDRADRRRSRPASGRPSSRSSRRSTRACSARSSTSTAPRSGS